MQPSTDRRNRFTRTDVLLAARVIAVGLAAPALVRLDLERLQRVLEPHRSSPLDLDQRAAAVQVERITAAALRRAGPLVRPGCLPRGLARYAAMRRVGIDVVLCFGVGRPKDELEGHCWLSLDGEVLFEPRQSAAAFTRVVGISGAGVR
jgi:hypothetical protein